MVADWSQQNCAPLAHLVVHFRQGATGEGPAPIDRGDLLKRQRDGLMTTRTGGTFLLLGALVATIQGAAGANALVAAPDAVEELQALANAGYDSDGDGVLDQPTREAATQLAAQLDVSVEDMSARTNSATLVVEPGGAAMYEDFGTPVRIPGPPTPSGDNTWVDVDYTLEPTANGKHAPVASPTEVVINTQGGDSTYAAEVALGEGSSVSVGFPGLPGPDGLPLGGNALGQASVEGGVATFPVAGYSASVDLVVAMTDAGVSTWVRLNEELLPDELAWLETYGVSFNLGTTGGAEVVPSEDAVADGIVATGEAPSGLVLTDAAGAIIGVAPEMLAWDGSVTDEGAIPSETLTIESDLEEPTQRAGLATADSVLTVTPPANFLTGGDVSGGVAGTGLQYPVVIDPQFESLTAYQDTWVRGDINANQGSDMKLLVGKHFDSGVNSAESFIHFTGVEAFAGEQVQVAFLDLYQYEAGSCDPRRMYIHRVTGQWGQNGMFWSNRPGVSPSGFHFTDENVGRTGCANTEPGAEDGIVTTEVTQIAAAWAGGAANYGMRLATAASDDHSFERRFCSSNTNTAYEVCQYIAYKPRLRVLFGTDEETYPEDALIEPTLPDDPSTGADIYPKAAGLCTGTTGKPGKTWRHPGPVPYITIVSTQTCAANERYTQEVCVKLQQEVPLNGGQKVWMDRTAYRCSPSAHNRNVSVTATNSVNCRSAGNGTYRAAVRGRVWPSSFPMQSRYRYSAAVAITC